jgi:hypothetical protein
MVKRYNPTGESLFSMEKSILEQLNHPGTVRYEGKYISPQDDRMYFVLKKPEHGV